jgi:hypothetical protein
MTKKQDSSKQKQQPVKKKQSERLTYELMNNGKVVKEFRKEQSQKQKPNHLYVVAKHQGKFKSAAIGVWKGHTFSLTQATGTPEIKEKTLAKLKKSLPKGVHVEKNRLTAQQTMNQNIYKKLFK